MTIMNENNQATPFSQRYNYSPLSILKYEQISDELAMDIWNIIIRIIFRGSIIIFVILDQLE